MSSVTKYNRYLFRDFIHCIADIAELFGFLLNAVKFRFSYGYSKAEVCEPFVVKTSQYVIEWN